MELTVERTQEPKTDRKGRRNGVSFSVRVCLVVSPDEAELLDRYRVAAAFPDPNHFYGTEASAFSSGVPQAVAGLSLTHYDPYRVELFVMKSLEAAKALAHSLTFHRDFGGTETFSLDG